MNKRIKLLFLISWLPILVSAQIELGLKAGLSSIDLDPATIVFNQDEENESQINLANAKYGFHFGIYSKIGLGSFFIEPSALLSSSSVDYRLHDLDNSGVLNVLRNETYHNLDIPLMIGVRKSILTIHGGLVAHIHLDSSSDLFDISGYSQRFKKASYGWQAGLSLEIFKILLEIRYEGNFNNFGDHITIAGHPYQFEQSLTRWIANIGLRF